MTVSEIVAIVAVGFVGYGVVQKLLSRGKDKQIQELDKERAKEEGKLDELRKADPKAEAVAEQSGASEEKKEQFWEEYLSKSKKND